jgi:dihydrofolate reductase
MRKIIAAINMTIDGFCDHTAGIADEEIHQHYADLLNDAGVLLYGRITYDLMKYWQTLLKNPSDDKTMNDFATAIDKVPKIVFSHSLKTADLSWDSATLSDQPLENKVLTLKNQPGKNIYVGSRSLIIQLMNLNLLDELQLCVQPVIGKGSLPLFENIKDRNVLKLGKTKTFSGGSVILYYEPIK